MIKRLLAFAAGFALATLAEAALPLSKAHAQTYDPQILDGGYAQASTPLIRT